MKHLYYLTRDAPDSMKHLYYLYTIYQELLVYRDRDRDCDRDR